MSELDDLQDQIDAATRNGKILSRVILTSKTWSRVQAGHFAKTGRVGSTGLAIFGVPVRIDDRRLMPLLVFA